MTAIVNFQTTCLKIKKRGGKKEENKNKNTFVLCEKKDHILVAKRKYFFMRACGAFFIAYYNVTHYNIQSYLQISPGPTNPPAAIFTPGMSMA